MYTRNYKHDDCILSILYVNKYIVILNVVNLALDLEHCLSRIKDLQLQNVR